jgi:hypothetical protein
MVKVNCVKHDFISIPFALANNLTWIMLKVSSELSLKLGRWTRVLIPKSFSWLHGYLVVVFSHYLSIFISISLALIKPFVVTAFVEVRIVHSCFMNPLSVWTFLCSLRTSMNWPVICFKSLYMISTVPDPGILSTLLCNQERFLTYY